MKSRVSSLLTAVPVITGGTGGVRNTLMDLHNRKRFEPLSSVSNGGRVSYGSVNIRQAGWVRYLVRLPPRTEAASRHDSSPHCENGDAVLRRLSVLAKASILFIVTSRTGVTREKCRPQTSGGRSGEVRRLGLADDDERILYARGGPVNSDGDTRTSAADGVQRAYVLGLGFVSVGGAASSGSPFTFLIFSNLAMCACGGGGTRAPSSWNRARRALLAATSTRPPCKLAFSRDSFRWNDTFRIIVISGQVSLRIVTKILSTTRRMVCITGSVSRLDISHPGQRKIWRPPKGAYDFL